MKWFAVLLGVGCLPAVYLMGCRDHRLESATEGHPIGSESVQPIKVFQLRFDALPLLACDIKRFELTLDRFCALDVPGLSGMAHQVRLASADGRRPERVRVLVDRMTDGVKCRDSAMPELPVIRRHGRGARYAIGRGRTAGEKHAGQSLAALAEAGVPLSGIVRVDEEEFNLGQLVDDQLECFTFDDEIEWRATIFALYRPTHAKWMNRYHESVSLDSIALELVRRWRQREFNQHSCQGLHGLQVLALLDRIQESSPCLSGKTIRAVQIALEDACDFFGDTQTKEGFWTTTFESVVAGSPTRADQLHMTGHVLEFLAMVPKELRPSGESISRAGEWLLDSLEGVTNEEYVPMVCACSHGLRAYSLAGIDPFSSER